VEAVDIVADWLQLALNAAAVVGGGVVWKMCFENLKTAVNSKQAEIDLAHRQVEVLKDKITDLEKRSPEVVERVLADRISIRESEIEKLRADKDQGSQELERVEQEVAVLRRSLDQTEGFRKMLAMESEPPRPGDPDYEAYQRWVEEHGNKDEDDEQVVEIAVEHLGNVGVDSGQLLITDPCYIDGEWQDEPYQDDRVYRDSETGAIVKWGEHFRRFDEPLPSYGETPNALIESGRLVQLPPPPTPDAFPYSYNGACQATMSTGHSLGRRDLSSLRREARWQNRPRIRQRGLTFWSGRRIAHCSESRSSLGLTEASLSIDRAHRSPVSPTSLRRLWDADQRAAGGQVSAA